MKNKPTVSFKPYCGLMQRAGEVATVSGPRRSDETTIATVQPDDLWHRDEHTGVALLSLAELQLGADPGRVRAVNQGSPGGLTGSSHTRSFDRARSILAAV